MKIQERKKNKIVTHIENMRGRERERETKMRKIAREKGRERERGRERGRYVLLFIHRTKYFFLLTFTQKVFIANYKK